MDLDLFGIKTNKKFSLNEKVLKRLLRETMPSSQNQSVDDLNIGFGFLYYSLVRNLKPKTVAVFGSAKGFSPICFALGIKDNKNNGNLYFVDAGYDDKISGKKESAGGVGFWNNKDLYLNLFKSFHVKEIIKCFIMKTSEFINEVGKQKISSIDLLFIDANHTYEGFKYDFETFAPNISKNGVIVFHDVLVERDYMGYEFGIKEYVENVLIKNSEYDIFRLPIWPGLCFAKKRSQVLNTGISNNDLKYIEFSKNKILEKQSYEAGELKKIQDSKFYFLWRIYSALKKLLGLQLRRG